MLFSDAVGNVGVTGPEAILEAVDQTAQRQATPTTARLGYRDLQLDEVVEREAVIAWDVVPEPDRYFRRQASVAAWAELPGKSFHAQCGSLQRGSIDTVLATLPPAWDLAGRQLEHFHQALGTPIRTMLCNPGLRPVEFSETPLAIFG